MMDVVFYSRAPSAARELSVMLPTAKTLSWMVVVVAPVKGVHTMVWSTEMDKSLLVPQIPAKNVVVRYRQTKVKHK